MTSLTESPSAVTFDRVTAPAHDEAMTDTADPPTCITDGCTEPRYHDRKHCHRHHRERRLTLPPGTVAVEVRADELSQLRTRCVLRR